jgi:hypothetical protein
MEINEEIIIKIHDYVSNFFLLKTLLNCVFIIDVNWIYFLLDVVKLFFMIIIIIALNFKTQHIGITDEGKLHLF